MAEVVLRQRGTPPSARTPSCEYPALPGSAWRPARAPITSVASCRARHDVRLIPAQYVKPFLKGRKNDNRDAEAIAEAVQRPTVNFVVIKPPEQMDLLALHRVRSRLVGQRTGTINQIRGFLIERGITVRQGVVPLRKALPDILNSNTDILSPRIVSLIADLMQDWRRLDERIELCRPRSKALARQDDGSRRLMTGGASANHLECRRGGERQWRRFDFAAWLGLVPKQESTGDRTILARSPSAAASHRGPGSPAKPAEPAHRRQGYSFVNDVSMHLLMSSGSTLRTTGGVTMQNEFESATQEAGAKEKAGAGALRDEARRTAEDLREQFVDRAETAKEQLGGMANSLKKKTREMADDQKATGAEQLSGLARASTMPLTNCRTSSRRPPDTSPSRRQGRRGVDHDPRAEHRRPGARDERFRAGEQGRVLRDVARGRFRASRRFLKSGAPSRSQPTSGGHHTPSQPHPMESISQRVARASIGGFLQPVLMQERKMGIHEHRTVPELFTDLIAQVTSLFRTETRLARAEINEKIAQAGGGVAMIVGGAVLLIPALAILLQAAVAALIEQGFESAIAALIVGGAAFLLGLVVALIGVNQLRVKKLTPQKTIEQLQSDAAVARNQVR